MTNYNSCCGIKGGPVAPTCDIQSGTKFTVKIIPGTGVADGDAGQAVIGYSDGSGPFSTGTFGSIVYIDRVTGSDAVNNFFSDAKKCYEECTCY